MQLNILVLLTVIVNSIADTLLHFRINKLCIVLFFSFFPDGFWVLTAPEVCILHVYEISTLIACTVICSV